MSPFERQKILLRYIAAETNMKNEFDQQKTFHLDFCTCADCKDIKAWFELSWWNRLMAKLEI